METPDNNGKRPVGRPPESAKGNKYAETHGIVTWRNAVKRRQRNSRSIIDRRTTAGQHALAMRNDLIEERGGSDNLSVAQLTLIELIARDTYFVDEIDRRIFAVMYRLRGIERGMKITKNPKAVGMLLFLSPIGSPKPRSEPAGPWLR